jgi:hypothetical protein
MRQPNEQGLIRRATFGTRVKINTPRRGACGERLKAAA